MSKVKQVGGWVSEMIGRVATRVRNLYPALVSVDATQTDHKFWDELSLGKRATFKLAGLFAKPIVHHIVSWMLGQGFTATVEDDYTAGELGRFARKNAQIILQWVKEGKRLGDAYLVVNPDGSLTLVPPDQVEVIVDDLDYRRVIGYRITTKLEKATVIDEYRLDGRTVTVKRSESVPITTTVSIDGDGERIAPGVVQYRYRNLIGRLPVLHYANNRLANELYGRPEYEALLELFAEYDDVLSNALKGVKLMGNPIPTLEHVDDPEQTRQALASGKKSYTDADGETHEEYVIDFDSLDLVITEGQFHLKGPNPFTEDAWRMLKNLFYLMLQHTNVPEFIWGGAIASSKASAEVQMPAWVRFIDGCRSEFEPLLIELLEIWRAFRALVDPRIDTDSEIMIQWPGLTEENEEIKLKKVEFARQDGMLTRKTGLEILNLVDDAAAEVEDADKEAEEAAADFETRAEREIERRLREEAELEGALA